MLVPGALDRDLAPVLAQFRAEGYARLGRVLDDDGLARLRARADAIMLGQVQYPGMFFQHDAGTGRYEDLERGRGYIGPTLAYRKIEKLERDPLFRAWIENALFERVARAWIDGAIAIYRAVLFTKPRGGGTVLPYHQDGGSFWGLDQQPTLQIWTALDDAPEGGGCLEIIPGTHANGLATPLGGVIPKDVLEARGLGDKVTLPAKAGEAVLVHNHVWHGSNVSLTGEPRRALSVAYMSAETRCLRKKRAPRAFVRVFEGGARRSAVEILAEAPGCRVFEAAEDVDAYVREERDAWDR